MIFRAWLNRWRQNSALTSATDSGSTTKSRLLIYGINYAPEVTGVGRYTGELAAAMAEQGHKVEVVTSPPHYPGWYARPPYSAARYRSEEIGGIRVIRCPIWLRGAARGIWRLIAPLSFAVSSAPVIFWRLIASRPDTLLCVEPTLLGAPFALLVAKLLRVKTVLHVQDLEVDAAFAVGHISLKERFRGWAFAVEGWLLRRFDRIVTISPHMADALAAKGVSRDRLTLIRNWVYLDRIQPLERPSIYRSELGLADDDFVALYSGQIGLKQALEVMLEAAKLLTDEPRIKFVVAGEGPLKDALIAKYGGLPNVRFLPLQSEARLCEFLNLADCHILPQAASIRDLVLPSKLGGMLASGKAILATADPGTELYDFLAGTATLVPAGESQAIATRLKEAVNGGLPHQPEKTLALAQSLSAERLLVDFEKVLTETA